MIIKSYLLNNPREKFLVTSQTDSVPIKKILATLNNNLLGFCIIKIKKEYKILTDGDFRRSILKDNSFIHKKSNKIKNKKLIVIDNNSTMYEAYRLMVKKKINCALYQIIRRLFHILRF